jgi:transposase
MTDSTHYVGIDVSKAQLDWASRRPSGERHPVPNTEAGVSGLVEQWRVAPPTAIVVEATGRLEVPLVSALAAAALPVSVVNPRQVRDFAKATGRWAKKDAIDAAVLAQFAEAVRPTPRPVADEATQELRARLTRRRQLLDMRTAEQQRLNGAPRRLHQQIQTHLAWLDHHLEQLDQDLTQLIRSLPLWREKGGSAAQRAGHWPGAEPDPPGGASRTRHAEPQATGGISRGRAAQSRQWHLLGRPRHRSAGLVYGDPGGHEMESCHSGVLYAAAGSWEARQSRAGGVHA